MAANDNGKGGKGALLDLRRQWSSLPAKKRLDALIDQTDAQQAVRSTPVAQLYYTLQEVGLADATEIVQLASPEQFRGFIDLGGWRKDRVEPHEVLIWLRAARGEEPEEFLPKLHGMDLEVLELLLRHYAVIHDLEEDPDANPSGVVVEGPEGKYLIELKADGVELVMLRQILQDLMGENPFEFGRRIEALRWELPTELEETAYQFRAARLADLGFPPLEEALSLFTRVDARAEPGTAGLVPASSAPVDYVGAALTGLNETERTNAEDELLNVANAVLVAEVADPGDLDAVRRASEMARDYLSLGFEHLTGGDASRATGVLREVPMKRIFQVGFTLTLQLKFRADRLMKTPLARVGDLVLLLDEEAAAVAALRRKRPLRALKVEGADPVAFRNRRELGEAEATLARAEAQVPLLAAVLGGSADRIKDAALRCADPVLPSTAERLFTSAVAWAVLERRSEVAPLPLGRLGELCGQLFEGPAHAPSLKASALDRAVQVLGQEARPMIDRVLRRLMAELAGPYLRQGSDLPSAVTELPIQMAPS